MTIVNGRRGCKRWILLATVASTVAGVALSLAWRYAVPRGSIDADPPPAGGPGDTGYFLIFDYQQYVSGPDWWPVSWATPLSAAIVGAVLATVVCVIARIRRRGVEMAQIAVVPILSGVLVGAVLARISRLHPPALVVRSVKDPSFRDFGPTGLPREEIYGAPPFFGIANAQVLLPVVGAGIGAIAVALGASFVVLSQKRQRRSGA